MFQFSSVAFRVALEKIGDDVEVMRLEAQNMDENILESQVPDPPSSSSS